MGPGVRRDDVWAARSSRPSQAEFPQKTTPGCVPFCTTFALDKSHRFKIQLLGVNRFRATSVQQVGISCRLIPARFR
jgi:hypothetical protein